MNRLRVALCIAQTALTVVLTVWADKMDWLRTHFTSVPPKFYRWHLLVIDLREIWRGVNAPTVPFNLTQPNSAMYTYRQVFGLSMAEILYFILVAILWYWVGYFFEERRRAKPTLSDEIRPKSRVKALLFVGWGLFVLAVAILQLPEVLVWGRIFRLVPFFKVLFYTAWSLSLMMLGVARLRASRKTLHEA
jgi:hypothetical protein